MELAIKTDFIPATINFEWFEILLRLGRMASNHSSVSAGFEDPVGLPDIT
jgi:hypothetical protein